MTETTVRYASLAESATAPRVVPFAPRTGGASELAPERIGLAGGDAQRKMRPGKSATPDPRYRRLLGERAWWALPVEVRRRFSRHLGAGEAIVYRGEVVLTELSRVGWLIAQAARLIGGPLPFTADATGPAVVTVTEEPALNGQIWSRQYPRPGGFPQVIHSAKRFTGPIGLEEYLGQFWGLGLVMRLSMHVEDRTLVFRSAGYALEFGGRRAFALPRWLWPGRCEIRHRAETDHRFSFSLSLEHPLLGRLIHQVAFFEDETGEPSC